MNKSLLARVRIWTILIASAAALVAWYAISLVFAAGLFLTAVWGVVGLMALEGILRSSVVPPGAEKNEFATVIWILVKIAVYGLAVWVLFSRPFPAVSHAVGFTLLMVTLVIVGAQSQSGTRGNPSDQTNRQDDDA